jgi:proteic killer suppression protein
MEVRFGSDSLRRLETDPAYDGGYAEAIVKAYRRRIRFIKQAPDERDLYKMNSLNFERLKGNRNHQYSMRLNDQWRLILEFAGAAPNKSVVVVGIEGYH